MKSLFLLSLTAFFYIICGCTTSQEGKPLRQNPDTNRKGLAVLNFQNTTPKGRGDRFQPWEYGLPAMLMTDIQSIGILNIISREKLRDILKEQALQYSGIVDPETAVKLGKIASVHYMLTGSFTEMNGELRVEAQVFSVEKGTLLGAAAVSGVTERFFEIEKELVFEISKYLKVILSEEEKKKIAMDIETKSVDASLSNYSGEMAVTRADRLFAEGKLDEGDAVLERAKRHFNKALSLDPKYKRAKRNLTKILSVVPLTL